MTSVGLWVSGHGFGHAVRCAEVARVLVERDVRVVVRSDAPAWLFPAACERANPPPWALDVGVAQQDGLELDIAETRRRWGEMAKQFDARVDGEAHILRQARVDVLLGDVPPLAFAAAAQAGIPSLALANFGWDWIYADWPAFDAPIGRIRDAYAQADRLLRLPLHSTDPDAFPAFRSIEDVPLVARLATRSRDAVRAELGLPFDACVVLLSFGGFDARGLELEALARYPEYTFVLTPPVAPRTAQLPANVRCLAGPSSDYTSLVAACDAVLTKPGYGIVADTLANRVPVLYTDRGPFREYPVLAEALETLGRARHIPREDVLRSRLGPHLEALWSVRKPWATLDVTGAHVVADRLCAMVN